MQIKTKMGSQSIPTRMSKIEKNLAIPNVNKDLEQLELSCIAGGSAT